MHIRGVDDVRRFLREERKRRGLTQGQLADRTATSQKWVSDFERGRVDPPISIVLKVGRYHRLVAGGDRGKRSVRRRIRILMPASIRLYGVPVGVLDVAKGGDLSFHYEKSWLERTQLPHHPLSLALPHSPDPYEHDRAGPFFHGLLPDSQQTREALARYLQVDATDDYALAEPCAFAQLFA